MTVAPEGITGRWCHWDQGPDSRPRFVAVGELDRDVVAPLAAVLNAVEPGSHPVVDIDLAGVTFLDAAATRVLLQYREAAERRGGAVRPINAAAGVQVVIDILWADPLSSARDRVTRPARRQRSVAELLSFSAEITATAHDTVARSQALCARLALGRRLSADPGAEGS
ncbi:STAS domain-containing protein [Actinoplanes sp. Pm04-4]|uniref:STAS domain-containing protein n=1 Tax=Paractinoplanes pyxinae TaxID=2997416 RepID=A0ABT4B7E0_9ACTN|nr:STAS domain-containing protein [Actinoplanes pyxinae]MCY1141510.1 STAS domain-containing protein [Actinoplanes pyxinae]